MIEKIIETYTLTFSNREEVLKIKEWSSGNYSYTRYTYNNNGLLVGLQTTSPLNKNDAYLKLEKEKCKYDKLFDVEYFRKERV